MVKLNNFKKLALATAFAAAGAFATTVASDAAASGGVSIPANAIDYDEAAFTFNTNGHSAVKYSLDGGKSWVKIANPQAQETIDISSLAAKAATITVVGCDNGGQYFTSESSIKLAAEEKLKFKIKYTPSEGAITFGDTKTASVAGAYEYRTATTAKWNSYGTLPVGAVVTPSVAKLEAKGGTFYVRAAGENTTKSVDVGASEDLKRPSKVLSAKVAAQAKAPVLKIDYKGGKVTGVNGKIEFTLRAADGKYYSDLEDTSKTSPDVVWLTTKATKLDILPFIAKSNVTMEARIIATAAKKESLSSELEIAVAAKAPSTTAIKFDYSNDSFVTADTGKYEYTLVSGSGITTVPVTAKWTPIKFASGKQMNIVSKITALKNTHTLFIRESGVTKKGEESLPSTAETYTIAPRPVFASKAAIEFATEQIVFANPKGLEVEFSTDKFATIVATTDAVSIKVSKIVNIDEAKKATAVQYRFAATKNTVASVAGALSIPARGAGTAATYNAATEIINLTVGKEYAYVKKGITPTSWIKATIKTLDHTMTEAMDVYQRTPATTKAFASHAKKLEIGAASARINEINLTTLLDGKAVAVSGTAIKAEAVSLTSSSYAAATFKFDKAVAEAKTGTEYSGVITLTPAANHKFKAGITATNAAEQLKLATNKPTNLTIGAITVTAPTATTTGKLTIKVKITGTN